MRETEINIKKCIEYMKSKQNPTLPKLHGSDSVLFLSQTQRQHVTTAFQMEVIHFLHNYNNYENLQLSEDEMLASCANYFL